MHAWLSILAAQQLQAPMNAQTDTYRSRLRKYQRRERMTIWIGAAYAALIALMTTKSFDQSNSPAALNALLVTLIVGGGLCLGRARIGFEWLATQIERQLEDGEAKPTDAFPVNDLWPTGIDRYWLISLYLIALAALSMLVSVWWVTAKQLWC